MSTRTPALTLPTIHMNGTSKRDLLESYDSARNAIMEAIDVVFKSCPNGRDYYPQGPNAINLAIEEHGARLHKLSDVAAEFLALMEHCDQ